MKTRISKIGFVPILIIAISLIAIPVSNAMAQSTDEARATYALQVLFHSREMAELELDRLSDKNMTIPEELNASYYAAGSLAQEAERFMEQGSYSFAYQTALEAMHTFTEVALYAHGLFGPEFTPLELKAQNAVKLRAAITRTEVYINDLDGQLFAAQDSGFETNSSRTLLEQARVCLVGARASLNAGDQANATSLMQECNRLLNQSVEQACNITRAMNAERLRAYLENAEDGLNRLESRISNQQGWTMEERAHLMISVVEARECIQLANASSLAGDLEGALSDLEAYRLRRDSIFMNMSQLNATLASFEEEIAALQWRLRNAERTANALKAQGVNTTGAAAEINQIRNELQQMPYDSNASGNLVRARERLGLVEEDLQGEQERFREQHRTQLQAMIDEGWARLSNMTEVFKSNKGNWTGANASAIESKLLSAGHYLDEAQLGLRNDDLSLAEAMIYQAQLELGNADKMMQNMGDGNGNGGSGGNGNPGGNGGGSGGHGG